MVTHSRHGVSKGTYDKLAFTHIRLLCLAADAVHINLIT